jgi:Fuc2NAc and GlcNAc transferase
MCSLLILIATLIMSLVMTGIVRRISGQGYLLDLPNERSAHTLPIPRSGGIAIFTAFTIGFICHVIIHNVAPHQGLVVLLGSAALFLVGVIDDMGHVPVMWRLAIQVAVVSVCIAILGGFPAARAIVSIEVHPIIVNFVVIVGIVWFINLFNFMDGIDALAAMEAISITFGGALIIVLTSDSQLILPLALVSAASLGFLWWNWPPAKIFMGDSGSGFLGICIGLLAIISAKNGYVSLWSWIILGGVFVCDASVTLIVRVFYGKKWYTPHNTHIYQILAREYESHKRIVIGGFVINVMWLFPLALIANMQKEIAAYIFVLAYFPLLYFVAIKTIKYHINERE